MPSPKTKSPGLANRPFPDSDGLWPESMLSRRHDIDVKQLLVVIINNGAITVAKLPS